MTSTKLPYSLTNCEEQNARYPDTFEVPPLLQRETVRFGDCVKLIFEIAEPDPAGPGAERMWVEVTTAEDGRYTGILVNAPAYVPLGYGDTIEFSSAHIASIRPGHGDAMIAEFPKEGSTDMTGIFDREPDVIITEEQAIAEGAAVDMDGWGIAQFRDEPVRTVSSTLFAALKAAFGQAASAGMGITIEDVREEYPDAQPGDGKTALVPPWAVLGDLLQVLIATAKDTAGEGEPKDGLYATEPLAALGGEPIWLQRPRPGQWTAFLPADY
jgi:hypothetical protein